QKNYLSLAPAVLHEINPTTSGSLELLWSCNRLPQGDGINVVLSTHWVIERREADGEWQRIGRIDNVDGRGTCRYVDSDVDHKKLFTYRILPESNDPAWQTPKRGFEKREPDQSTVIAARGPDPWRLEFSCPSEANEHPPTTVKVKII